MYTLLASIYLSLFLPPTLLLFVPLSLLPTHGRNELRPFVQTQFAPMIRAALGHASVLRAVYS